MKSKDLLISSLCLLALLGVGLAAYPLISNYYYDHSSSAVITEYQQAEADTDLTGTRDAARDAARAYNDSLCAIVRNQFSGGEDDVDYSDVAEILNISGNGVIAYIEIPTIDLYLPVYYGTQSKTLQSGVSVVEGSSLPIGGASCHSVIAGHSGISTARLFSDIDRLEEGDRFYLHVLDDTLTYQVDQIVTVLPDDVSQIGIVPGKDYCTLLTCTPYGVNTHRLLVRGIRTEADEALHPVSTGDAWEDVQNSQPSTWINAYLFAVIWGISGFFFLVIVSLAIWQLSKKLRKGGRKK